MPISDARLARAVDAYDVARRAAHGSQEAAMSERNRQSIAPMIYAAIMAYFEPDATRPAAPQVGSEEVVEGLRRAKRLNELGRTECKAKFAEQKYREANASIDRAIAALASIPTGRDLDNLLAVIHRDGGHYQAAHGREKAVVDAMQIVLGLIADREGIRAAVEALANDYQTSDEHHPDHVLIPTHKFLRLCVEADVVPHSENGIIEKRIAAIRSLSTPGDSDDGK